MTGKYEYDSSITRKRLTDLRNEKGFTQAQLAKKTHLKRSDIAHYETDRTIPIDKLYKIAKYLGTSTDYLLGLTDSKSPKISDVAICNRIGLKNKQVKILEKIKNDKIMDTINFLIAQEEDVLLDDVIPPIEYTNFNKIQYEKAEKDYWKEVKELENNCKPILRLIHKYLSVKTTENDIYFMPDGTIKRLCDFKYKVDRYLANETINTKEMLEEIFLTKIENQLKNAKNDLKEGEEN